MKKIGLLIIVLLLLNTFAVTALTSGEAKQEWQNTKQASKDAQEQHRNAKVDFAANNTEENKQKVVDTGKVSLHAALDEAEAWLVWKDIETDENQEVPQELKDAIKDDVEANLEKIDDLRTEVDGVTNQLELGVVFLKMVGKYFELLTDVARNSGMVWVHIGNERADTIENYENKLRDAAESMNNNEDILEKLDLADSELETARNNINNAENEYGQVKTPGQPLIKFSNGNNYLKIAKGNMLSANNYLMQAYTLILAGGN